MMVTWADKAPRKRVVTFIQPVEGVGRVGKPVLVVDVGEGDRERGVREDGDGQLSLIQHPPRYRLFCQVKSALLHQAGANLSTSTNTFQPPPLPWSMVPHCLIACWGMENPACGSQHRQT